MACKLFVGGTSPNTTNDSLRAHFSQFGPIDDAVVMRDRGFGFVTFSNQQAADAALANSKHDLDGSTVDVKTAVAKGRDGGGAGGGGGGGGIADSLPIINNYQGQLPANLDMLEIRSRLKDEDYTPFVIVSLQESDRMNGLLSHMRMSMTELELGISGALNVTDKMEDLSKSLQLNKVNDLWAEKAYPSLKLLKAWFEDLLLRVDQCVEWTKALTLLKSIWLSGLFNSMSFLTSNMQVASRSTGLPLDFMRNRCRFYNIRDLAEVSGVPAQGVNCHGLYMEGAGWEDGKGEEEGYITESKMKDLHPAMPIVNIWSVPMEEMDWTAMYHCPVFSTSKRGATFIFQANVRMDPDEDENRWILAGAALLTQDD